jgi:hypothetical protein
MGIIPAEDCNGEPIEWNTDKRGLGGPLIMWGTKGRAWESRPGRKWLKFSSWNVLSSYSLISWGLGSVQVTTLESAFSAASREKAIRKNRRPRQVSPDSTTRSKHEQGRSFVKRLWGGSEDINAWWDKENKTRLTRMEKKRNADGRNWS